MFWSRVLLAATLYSSFNVNNGQQFGNDEHSKGLLDHLTESEKLFLLGANPNAAQFEIAHLKQTNRQRRSIYAGDHNLNSIKKHLDLKLSPRDSFLDRQFLLIRRWSNRTETDLDQHVDEELDQCFHRSDKAALYMCGDVRGIVKSNDSYYLIHPLPERFHSNDSKVHVIVKRSTLQYINNDNNNRKETEPVCLQREELDSVKYQSSRRWTKHRRKRDIDFRDNKNSLEEFKSLLHRRNKTIEEFIEKLNSGRIRQKRATLPAIFVETAVFIDRDLYKHMTINFPTDTERELVRFVLAMINAVQLIYHDPSLGRPVNYILKRLEILHEDPANLKRPHDIDRFLSNFCTWQRLENPPGDNDPLHWDHALILTGLDLYVVSKNGKVSSQVVGLAPVAGMCTMTSSCTVNEGRHFESVYVVAHEIGHNLGMRHDGPAADNGCDPTAYIMSPTLGSGKITWSQCSKNYLEKFLDSVQSQCLFDHGNSAGQLDHSAEGILPGERFDADQQCMLKYGRGSRHSALQNVEDVCRDLHCQRERYTWTSHPALEGTKCGEDMHCRGGECVERSSSGPAAWGRWSGWSGWSECASACLLDDSHLAAATGVAVATRKCNRPRHDNNKHNCAGNDKKYQACSAKQCNNVPRMTVRDFADQICSRAREVDPDLIGTGLQRIDSDDVMSPCAVWCDTRGGGYKSRGWTLPDGTACSKDRPMYCINGLCQRFSCSSSADTEFSLRPGDCEWEALQLQTATPHSTTSKSSGPWRREIGSQWRPTSGCHYHCIHPGSGVRLVQSTTKQLTSIQLCRPDNSRVDTGCTLRKTPYHYATMVCGKYKERVRRLSGLGMQISPVVEDPDRPCRVACQDERVPHRFYMVNGQDGWFPLGTACSNQNTSYCVSGKCLEFGPDNTPVSETVFTLPLLPRSMSVTTSSSGWRTSRHRRSLLPERAVVTANLTTEHLRDIIAALNLTENSKAHAFNDRLPEKIELDFNNPIHITPEETLLMKKPRPTWD